MDDQIRGHAAYRDAADSPKRAADAGRRDKRRNPRIWMLGALTLLLLAAGGFAWRRLHTAPIVHDATVPVTRGTIWRMASLWRRRR
ncbi:hypothetical protein [Labrys monachus]|uniref:Uncharacterized protein n=1 Tax=Labrys monachus TaxID=217067 RepID=A0ABU0FGK9_9HYPH|nr:hypothetical protein [Labrys monachus]MDQ0393666.1 hypothetical protein [Labrys monachus]